MPIVLPPRYNNAPIRPADQTREMLDLYGVVAQTNAGISPRSNQTVVPTDGQTVQMTNDNTSGTLWLTPSGSLSALTINFPSDANSDIGQYRRFACSKAITTLTLAGGTILNPTTTMNLNDCFCYEKVAANTWILCQ